MVNWRENVEFCYVLFMLISGISIFFGIYEVQGLQMTGIIVVAVVVVEAIIGFVVFETDRAIAKWEKMENRSSK